MASGSNWEWRVFFRSDGVSRKVVDAFSPLPPLSSEKPRNDVYYYIPNITVGLKERGPSGKLEMKTRNKVRPKTGAELWKKSVVKEGRLNELLEHFRQDPRTIPKISIYKERRKQHFSALSGTKTYHVELEVASIRVTMPGESDKAEDPSLLWQTFCVEGSKENINLFMTTAMWQNFQDAIKDCPVSRVVVGGYPALLQHLMAAAMPLGLGHHSPIQSADGVKLGETKEDEKHGGSKGESHSFAGVSQLVKLTTVGQRNQKSGFEKWYSAAKPKAAPSSLTQVCNTSVNTLWLFYLVLLVAIIAVVKAEAAVSGPLGNSNSPPAPVPGGRTIFKVAQFALVVCIHPPTQRILMVHETQKRGWWIPGGGVDGWESPEEAAVRETIEEAGVRPHIKGILRVEYGLSGRDRARMRLMYYAEPEKDEMDKPPKQVADSESLEARWMTLEEVEALNEANQLRGPEPLEWLHYLMAGGPVYPKSMFVEETEPVLPGNEASKGRRVMTRKKDDSPAAPEAKSPEGVETSKSKLVKRKKKVKSKSTEKSVAEKSTSSRSPSTAKESPTQENLIV